MTLQIAAAIVLGAAIAYAAYRAHALSASGAVAAAIVGAVTFGIASWHGALVLFAFFLPSTLLSRIGKRKKRALDGVAKGGRRDAWQVAANGGIAALALLLSPRYPVAAVAFAGAFAAASADTWGTEIGTLAAQRPRSILTLRPIDTGLSGGITLAGTLATMGGAVVVGAAAALTGMAAFVPVAIAGIFGAFADSVLGASAQALRYCPSCDRDCETNPHACGAPTQLRRGAAWMENDAVNLAATAVGATVALAAVRLF